MATIIETITELITKSAIGIIYKKYKIWKKALNTKQKKIFQIIFIFILVLIVIGGILIAYYITPHNGKIKYPNGDEYLGIISRNIPEGLGELNTANGDTISGVWQNGDITEGELLYSNGDLYKGELSGNIPNGLGKMLYTNGNRMEGTWEDGDIKKGLMRYQRGDSFEFTVSENKNIMEGLFKFFITESSFEGVYDFRNEKLNFSDDVNKKMTGKYTYKNGDVEESEFYWHTQLHTDEGVYTGMSTIPTKETPASIIGYGKYKYNNGDSYEGELRDGKKDGFGVLEYNNGDVYKGMFTKGNRHGIGKMYFAEGSIELQQYENDIQIPCEINMTVVLDDGTDKTNLKIGQTYKVSGGETIRVNAESDVAEILYIGYYFGVIGSEVIGDVIDCQGNTAIINVPNKPQNNSKLEIFIEAVDANDDASESYVTKTGWYFYYFDYSK